MALVKIKFAPSCITIFMGHDIKQVRADLAAGQYDEESALFTVNGDSKDAAEEVFDLTNNPSRQDERKRVYGRGRSLSTGDIVVVGDEQWLCMSFGWKEL